MRPLALAILTQRGKKLCGGEPTEHTLGGLDDTESRLLNLINRRKHMARRLLIWSEGKLV
jgi:hypothetical protein